VFGSVAYLKEEERNYYSVTQNIILITFSYIGNIMMVNILTAFLNNQYSKISEKASYVTKKMQYSILKSFSTETMGCVFLTPIFINFVYVLIAPFMIFGCFRKNFIDNNRINLFLSKVSHVITVTIPMTIFIGIMLLVMIPYIYLRLFFRFLSLLRISTDKRENISKFGSRVVSFILFVVFGILILLFMWVKDIMFLMKILLDFEVVNIGDFLNKKFSEDEKLLYRKMVKDFIFMCE
jgi:hypothetical protein